MVTKEHLNRLCYFQQIEISVLIIIKNAYKIFDVIKII